ncbi:MAG: single-stranded DNA-binding protein [Ginsengibacter sp.]
MIKLQIIGHLGTDCTTTEVNGKTVINFPVAHSEKYKDQQGNMVEKTIWVKCAYWTDRTAIAQYLKKGQMIYAEGTPEAEGYLNKDNQNAASLKLKVFQVQLLGSKNDNQPGGSQQSSSYQSSNASTNTNANQLAPSQVEEAADDLPF